MVDSATRREALAQDLISAERAAAEGRAQIDHRLEVLRELSLKGHDTAAAQAALALLRENQATRESTVRRLIMELQDYDAQHRDRGLPQINPDEIGSIH
jgi:hypothetical protein